MVCLLSPQKNCSIMVNSSNSVGGILSVSGANNNNNNNSLPPPGKASKSSSSNSGVGSANDNDDRWILLSSLLVRQNSVRAPPQKNSSSHVILVFRCCSSEFCITISNSSSVHVSDGSSEFFWSKIFDCQHFLPHAQTIKPNQRHSSRIGPSRIVPTPASIVPVPFVA